MKLTATTIPLIVIAVACTMILGAILFEIRKTLLSSPPKGAEEVPEPPRASLTFELLPKDEATSLLMGTLTNTGNVPLENVTLNSSMQGRILPLGNFVYIDEGERIPGNGSISLTPGSTVKYCLGSVKLSARVSIDFLKNRPKAQSGVLTINATSLGEDVARGEGEIAELGQLPGSEAPKDKEPKENFVPLEKDGKIDKKAVREAKKREKQLERDRAKIAKEEGKAKGEKADKKQGAVKPFKAPKKQRGKDSPTATPEAPEKAAVASLNASFSIPLHHGVFTQAEAQMLYFYKRDLLFEKAESKDEVFENTLTFEGNPTRNLYRERGREAK